MSELYKNKYRIKSSRHPTWDYASNGYYFVTICTKNKESFFGDIVNEKIELNRVGKIVEKYWGEIPKHFSNIKLDEFVIMPNHLHGIIVIENDDNRDLKIKQRSGVLNGCKPCGRDAINRVSTLTDGGGVTGIYNPMGQKSLGEIIRWYKGRCSFEIRKNIQEKLFAWQPRFYDHIIQKPQELFEIQKYIQENPLKWHLDKYFL